ncbi:MAG: PHB depolymerase family esterase, partial [Pseudomonadota bacterium]|nr:PHB depolymerase family esterase [Pseudomonadota bacterium]
MDKKLALLAALCALAGVSLDALGGRLVTKTYPPGVYEGSRERRYQVYVPDNYRPGTPVPMVMVLHGCRQTEQNMINETRFRQLADRDTFIVVYPFITSFDGLRNTNCWGFFLNQHTHEGAGEPEDLYQIGLAVESEFSIDPNRRYITGLSSGAGMAVVMAVVQSEYFAAAGAAAGLPYSETSSSVGFVCSNPGSFRSVEAVVAAIRAEQRAADEGRTVPMMTVHSNNDCTVNRQGGVNIRDSWLRRYGASPAPYESTDCTTEGVSCAHLKFGAPGRSVVETVFYEGERGGFTGEGSHYWVGDNRGEFANPNGPSASELFWSFFQRHPFTDNAPPTITIAAAS